jgi:hypothetical protein
VLELQNQTEPLPSLWVAVETPRVDRSHAVPAQVGEVHSASKTRVNALMVTYAKHLSSQPAPAACGEPRDSIDRERGRSKALTAIPCFNRRRPRIAPVQARLCRKAVTLERSTFRNASAHSREQ